MALSAASRSDSAATTAERAPAASRISVSAGGVGGISKPASAASRRAAYRRGGKHQNGGQTAWWRVAGVGGSGGGISRGALIHLPALLTGGPLITWHGMASVAKRMKGDGGGVAISLKAERRRRWHGGESGGAWRRKKLGGMAASRQRRILGRLASGGVGLAAGGMAARQCGVALNGAW